jgi:uncharacterized protein (DUF39 family)
MAVLSLPALAMVKHHPIATFNPLNLSSGLIPSKTTVRHPIPEAKDVTCSDSRNLNPLSHDLLVGNGKIGSLVAIGGHAATAKVLGSRPWIAIGVLQNKAVLVGGAGDGQP